MEAVKVGKTRNNHCSCQAAEAIRHRGRDLVTTEALEDGVLIRPAVVVPVEKYTPERKAEFLLSTATTKKD